MGYRNHCNTLAAMHYTGGRNWPIAWLACPESPHPHRIETWGNSREGFMLYLVTGSHKIPLSVSSIAISSGAYTLRRDAVAAAKRAYGDNVTVARGNNWF